MAHLFNFLVGQALSLIMAFLPQSCLNIIWKHILLEYYMEACTKIFEVALDSTLTSLAAEEVEHAQRQTEL